MKKPSEFHRDLKEDRISAVAQLIAQAYSDSLDYIIPEKGDTRWSHGCRRYEWARNNIRQVANSKEHPYLSLLEDEGRKFTFKIGAVPVRFKRTDADNPNSSVFRQHAVEASQLSLLLFDGLEDPCQLSWRILVEDDIEGDVIRVAFVGADENGQAECFWNVPKDKLKPKLVALPTDREEGVELQPALVGLKVKTKDEKKA